MKTTTCRARRPRRPVKRIVSIILSICMLLSLTAGLDFSAYADGLPSSGSCGDSANYTFNSSTGELIISGSGEIYSSSFFRKNEIKKVIINSGITFIGNSAFNECSNILSISFPNTLKTINPAFCGCTGLTSINIPANVTSIASGAFEDCSGLTSISVNSSNTVYDSRNNCNAIIKTSTNDLCKGCKNTVIPNTVKTIYFSAFYGCEGLTSISIPNSVTSIEAYAFYGCEGLTSISIPKSVTSIGFRAFSFCSGLSSISIPTSVKSIYSYAFGRCTGLSSITIPNSVKKIYEGVFSDCTGLTSINIPSSVTSIGEHAFSGCKGLTSITIPSSVTSIGEFAFSGCSGLTSITIPSSVTSIGSSAFSGCTGLTSITIPDSVTSIGSSAFSGCTGLTSISIPSSVTSIGASAFYECTSLSSIVIPSSVEIIDYYLFEGCNSLKSVTIPKSVTSIHSGAFKYCSALERIELPNSITSIDEHTFKGCNSLTTITIPDSVTYIGQSAFYGCSGLKEIRIPCSVKFFNTENTFKNCTNIEKIVLTSGTGIMPEYGYETETSATNNYYQYMPWYISRNSLKEIVIEDGVTNITSNAFNNCTNLTSITIFDKECTMYNSSNTIPSNAIIYGYKNSTAETYAKSYKRTFIALDADTDTVKPSGSISSTNNVAASQTATLTLSDDKGVAGYYWGTNSNYSSNTYTATSSTSVKKTVSNAGTYYLTVKDTSGNISDTVSITYYKTTLNANGGSISPASVITKKGNSFTFPTPIMDGYTYQGWSTSSTATSGVKTLNPSGNKTYYAVWKANQQTAPGEEQHVHDYISKVVAPTCTENGYTLKLCTVCGNTYKTEYTFATGHKPVADKVVPATFVSAGKTAGTHCSVCGKVIVAQKPVAMLGAAKLSKVKKGKKSFTATWKSVANVDGYEIQYSLKKNMKKAKTKSVASSKKKLKVKKLKAKKKYYVRIRAYKVINGKKQYSAWSAKKKVKTK